MDAGIAPRPSRNPRFDRKRSRSRSPTVARSLSPPSSHRRRRRSPSPVERDPHHAKRQRLVPSASQEGGAPRPFGRVSARGGATRHTNVTDGNYNNCDHNCHNNNRRNINQRGNTNNVNRGNTHRRDDGRNNYRRHHHNNNKRYNNRVGGDDIRQRATRPVVVESWADASGSDDEDRDDDTVRHDMGDQQMCVDGDKQHRENVRGGDNGATRRGAGRRQPNDDKGAERSPSPCLVPDSEDEYQQQHSDDDVDDDDHDRRDNNDRDDHPLDERADDRDRGGSGDEEGEEQEEDEEEDEGESMPAADSNTTAGKDDERTRALRTLASTTFGASGPADQTAYKRPKRSGRRGKGSAERRRLRMMQKRLGIDVTAPAPEAAVHHIGGPADYRRVDNRHAQRGNPEPADNATRHRQGRVEASRHHPHHGTAKDEETLRRQRISTIDAKKHINAYHEACRRAFIDRVPPPPPPPENMFALVSDAVDLFLAGRTSPRP